jgi:hypothetical protein
VNVELIERGVDDPLADAQVTHDSRALVALEDADLAHRARVLLRSVHGRVRVCKERPRCLRRLPEDYPDADRDAEARVADRDWRLKRLDETSCEAIAIRGAKPGPDDSELVAAEADDQVIVTHDARQAIG